MNPDTRATGALRPGDDAATGAVPADIVAQRLIAVPWRHAGLIALLALAGGLASTTFWPPQPPVRAAAATKWHVQAIQDAPSPADAGIALRLELDVGAAAPPLPGATQMAAAPPSSSSSLRLDGAAGYDDIDAELRQAPPAAGRLLMASPEPEPDDGDGRSPMLPGLVAGLLLGLLVAALRELGGDRLRSPREAQWALGAPVLGAIPTLSARARDALLEPPAAVPGAA